jgi:hypothetical protein
LQEKNTTVKGIAFSKNETLQESIFYPSERSEFTRSKNCDPQECFLFSSPKIHFIQLLCFWWSIKFVLCTIGNCYTMKTKTGFYSITRVDTTLPFHLFLQPILFSDIFWKMHILCKKALANSSIFQSVCRSQKCLNDYFWKIHSVTEWGAQ